MKCDFVSEVIRLENAITAETEDEFRLQFKNVLKEARGFNGIVYVMRAGKEISRLCGSSDVIYVGRSINNLYDRYKSKLNSEVDYFRSIYKFVVSEYGQISFDIYVTVEPLRTESRFLHQYCLKHKELPPVNLENYKTSLL